MEKETAPNGDYRYRRYVAGGMALTAAMAQLFNAEMSNKRRVAERERALRKVGEVHGRGDSLVFEGGNEIVVEPYSHTLGGDMFAYEVNYWLWRWCSKKDFYRAVSPF